jgi:hypothetical protein
LETVSASIEMIAGEIAIELVMIEEEIMMGGLVIEDTPAAAVAVGTIEATEIVTSTETIATIEGGIDTAMIETETEIEIRGSEVEEGTVNTAETIHTIAITEEVADLDRKGREVTVTEETGEGEIMTGTVIETTVETGSAAGGAAVGIGMITIGETAIEMAEVEVGRETAETTEIANNLRLRLLILVVGQDRAGEEAIELLDCRQLRRLRLYRTQVEG